MYSVGRAVPTPKRLREERLGRVPRVGHQRLSSRSGRRGDGCGRPRGSAERLRREEGQIVAAERADASSHDAIGVTSPTNDAYLELHRSAERLPQRPGTLERFSEGSIAGSLCRRYEPFVLGPVAPRASLWGFSFRLAALALAAWVVACQDTATSEYVADQFADAYFRRFDQEAALAYTALGATEMLDKELLDTKAIRESYTPAEAAANVIFTRDPPTPREARVDYHYVITARPDDDSAPVVREADIELAKIAGSWKVVMVHFVR